MVIDDLDILRPVLSTLVRLRRLPLLLPLLLPFNAVELGSHRYNWLEAQILRREMESLLSARACKLTTGRTWV